MDLRKLTLKELPLLVGLHYEVLPNEFLTSISENFLLGFYQNLFSSPYSHFLGAFISITTRSYGTGNTNNLKSWVAEAEGVPSSARSEFFERGHRTGRASDRTHLRLVAAIVGLEEKYKPNVISYLLLILKNLPAFLTSPKSIISLFQSFLFKIGQPQETEIFFIGVKKQFQGQNIGKKIIAHIEQILSSEYKTLSVDCKCKLPSNNFYKACGFKVKKTFKLYNETWNRYEKSIW